MNVNDRQSDSYIGTFDVKCTSDMQRLSDLRQMVRYLNCALKNKTGKTFRIIVRGRKPVVKMPTPKAYLTAASRGPVSYTRFGNIVGGLSNATRLDAYLYERR